MDPDAKPRFCKAQTVPYAMRGLVDEELDKLVREGILEPVENSDWASPIVAVLKPDKKTVRICGDFRSTVNPVSKLNTYPIRGGLICYIAEGEDLYQVGSQPSLPTVAA